MKFIPNVLTVLRILVTPLFVFALLEDGWQVYAVVIFLVASLTDWYDGYLARKYGYSSDWGKFLDPLADKILVLAAFFSFAYLGVVKLWMVMVIVTRDFIITGLRSYAMSKDRPMITNLIAKLKTATQMTMIVLILIVIALQSILAQFALSVSAHIEQTVSIVMKYNVIYSGMLIVTLLTTLSGCIYLYQNRESLRQLSNFIQFK